MHDTYEVKAMAPSGLVLAQVPGTKTYLIPKYPAAGVRSEMTFRLLNIYSSGYQ